MFILQCKPTHYDNIYFILLFQAEYNMEKITSLRHVKYIPMEKRECLADLLRKKSQEKKPATASLCINA